VDDDDALEEFINDGEVDFETGSEGTMDVDDTTSQANSDINGGDDDNDDDEEDDDTSSATASDVSEESQNLVPAEYDINLQRTEEEFFELYVMYMLHYAHEPHILEKVQVQDSASMSDYFTSQLIDQKDVYSKRRLRRLTTV
jgi:hypothetical protein